MKIVMITGIQCSGTSALLKSLSRDSGVVTINESLDNELFCSWNLRPEAKIRPFLANMDKTLLTKPVNETRRRSIVELFNEYRDYDLRVIFLYRNPVNVYFSQLMKRVKDKTITEFIDDWNSRNRHVIEAMPRYKDRIFLVSYEDIIADKRVFRDLCNFAGINGKSVFRKDSNKGMVNFRQNVIDKIEHGTSEVIELLNKLSSIQGGHDE